MATAGVMAVLAVAVVTVSALAVAARGTGRARGTSDFYVAGRSVAPAVNAAAIGGEYLSAASFLGITGVVLVEGVDALWLPVGYTVGYVVLLVLVAAPLRRSGAYTLADFAELRLGGSGVRRGAGAVVVVVGLLYLLPQFVGAAITWRAATGLPGWGGVLVVAAVVVGSVWRGGMRSITLVQAVQFWIKLMCIAVPAAVLVVLTAPRWTAGADPGSAWHEATWWLPVEGAAGLYAIWSTMLALALGTMGLPHVLVRFYTNPDGAAARRTTSTVIGLLGTFYVWPPVYALLALALLPGLTGPTDQAVVEIPRALAAGPVGEVLSAVVVAGAFAAFTSTASGLAVSVAGVAARDLPARSGWAARSPVAAFRLATLVTVALPALAAAAGVRVPLATTVALAFALAASTFAPLLVLGIWWPRLRRGAALAGMATGAATATTAAVLTLTGVTGATPAPLAAALSQPAAWSVPLASLVMIVGSRSLARRGVRPVSAAARLAELHRPDTAPGTVRPRTGTGP